VVLAYLDLKSFQDANQNPMRPWPRELHAQLLQRLKTAGARAVVFDIVFTGAGADPEADQALAAAIRDHGRVILAAEYNNKISTETDDTRDSTRLGLVETPFEPFLNAAAGWGIATFSIDDDKTARRYVAGFPDASVSTLVWATATALKLPAATNAGAMPEANQRWIRYYGPPLTIPHVSYSQAFDPVGVPNDFFRGKIVFVGARPQVELFNAPLDEFRSPFHSWQYKELFMPGVEVHATEMLNLLRGDWLRRLSPAEESFWLFAAALLFGGGLLWLRPLPAALTAGAGAGIVLIVSLAGFHRGVWFPWLIVAGVQIPTALAGSVLFNSVEWYRMRRRLEAARRLAEAKIREQAALIDKAHDAILVQDLAGKILYANPSAERLYGWTSAQLLAGAAEDELFSPDAAAAQTACTTALQQGEWNGELRQQTRSGQAVIVASRWTLIRDDAGRPRGLLLINSDITEKKLLEAQFLRTQRMNTVGTLAGGMAHDLNNALAPILMGVQLLRRKTIDEDAVKLLGLMETNTIRGADLVRQVLLFARGRGGEFERLEPGPLVREMEKLVRETFPKNIAVESFLPEDLWAVRGNPTQIHQVLLNLCVNARDAMPDGGRLSFAADNVELTAAEAAAIPEAKSGEYVSLLVSDTGTGIPPEVRAKMFEAFFTTKGEGRGTGIGLSTVMGIVKSHGGCLRVESEPGQGTIFEVFLPRAAGTASAEPSAASATPPRGDGELILVADDERAIRELIGDGLTSQGYRVLVAADGAGAFELFKQHQSAVRLFLTDAAMPVMDGARAIAEVRRLQPGLPVILTGAGPADAQSHESASLIRLPKPFSLDELLTVVATSLGKKR
jgi:PAS domain S-box-containing protein